MTDNKQFIPNLTVDEDWQLQGRVIPPSCDKTHNCLLHLQTKRVSWPVEHFHRAQINIPLEMGIEIQASVLQPPSEELVVFSFSPVEQNFDIEYLSMNKFIQPEDAIGFVTVNGLVFVIQNKGLDTLFSTIENCPDCNPLIVGVSGNLDELMLVIQGETNH